tara:strand:+ start:408 stop:3041 length:2634 start_codon:yes stop_codon:yes gene_type:complete
MNKQIKNQELKSNEMDMEEQWNEYIKPDYINIKNYSNKDNYNCKVPIETWIIDVDHTNIPDNKLHEWLTADLFVKPYYDFDMACKSKEEMEEQFKIILESSVDKLCKVFNCTIDDMGISTCNRKKKKVAKKDTANNYFVSIHIIVNTHYCLQGKLEEFNIQNDIHEITGYDKSVYSNGRNFRMIYQSKAEKDSKPFIPYNNKEPEDIFKHIIQFTSDNAMYPYDIKPCIIKYSPPVSPIPVDPISTPCLDTFDLNIKIKKIKKYLYGIKTKYEYDDWWKVGSAIARETHYTDEGLKLWKEWSSLDPDSYDENTCDNMWNNWTKNKYRQSFTMGSLVKWYNDECQNNEDIVTDNIYQWIYKNHPDKPLKYEEQSDGKYEWVGIENIDGLIQYINKELIFIRETGETIIIDNKDWYTKKRQGLLELYAPHSFNNIKNKKINPANLWFNHKNRREVLKIGFDPKENPNKNIFNIWTGMRIKKEISDEFDVKDCDKILYHIKYRWCDGNEENYNYVMNWLAHLCQKPWIKMGVVLCLKSLQGSGKGIILNIMRKIIGDQHYFQCNNLEQLTGNFNGVGEGKILTNLDESHWAKDKKVEGMLKNMITESTKLINKKNKENYIIDDFNNFIITTNNDCFAPATEHERRFYCLELNDELCGIQTPQIKKIIDDILNCPVESFAKVLYNRDITNFNPRLFKKTETLQKQVQQMWCNIREWWFTILNEQKFISNDLYDGCCIFGEVPESLKRDKDSGIPDFVWGVKKIKYKKDKHNKKIKSSDGEYIIDKQLYLLEKQWIYKNYQDNAKDKYMVNTTFWEKFKKYCVSDFKTVRHGDSQKRYIVMKDITEYQQTFNKLQNYEYNYNNCEIINDSSDDEYYTDSDDE